MGRLMRKEKKVVGEEEEVFMDKLHVKTDSPCLISVMSLGTL